MNKYVTCYINNKPYISHESAIRMAMDLKSIEIRRLIDNKTNPSRLVERSEMINVKGDLVLFVWPDKNDYCPFSAFVFINGAAIDWHQEESAKEVVYSCCFTGKISIDINQKAELSRDTRDVIKKHLERKLYQGKRDIVCTICQ